MNNPVPTSAKIGEFVVIEDGVSIGENVSIGHHSIIKGNTQIGDNVVIGSHCILGIQPSGNDRMRSSDASVSLLKIGSNTKVGNYVSIYTGSEISEGVFIADLASIRENVIVGEGTVIGRNAMVELNTRIGAHCTIQTLAYITGDTVLEDYVFIGPNVSMSNDKYMGTREYTMRGPTIRSGSKIGNNASLLPDVTIGANAIVGAGAVVTKDVTDNTTVVGVPAHTLYQLRNSNSKEERNDSSS